MKETVEKFVGLSVVENGFMARHINEYRAKFSPMSRWHFMRKPYTWGGAPLGERR